MRDNVKMYQTITSDNMLLTAYDQGDDVRVVLGLVGQQPERWFTRHRASRNETFPQAVVRIFKQLAKEYKTEILPIVPEITGI